MTKLEFLLSYSNIRILDTWFATGSAEVGPTTRFYAKDQLFIVNDPTSSLDGVLLFAKEDFAGTINWTQGSLADYTYGEITFGSSIIDPRFRMILTKKEVEETPGPRDETWVPYVGEISSLSDVTIPQNELDIMLTDVGIPFISYEELEYPKKDILNLMVKPALEEYFKWFPKIKLMTYPISNVNQIEHPFPDGAYDVVHVTVNQGVTGSGASSNPLMRYFDEVVWNAGSPSGGAGMGGMKRPRTRMTDWGGMMLDRAGRQAVINYGTRLHHQVVIGPDGKRRINVISNKMGTLQVHYAMHSLDWNDVEFARRPELRELCRAHVLRAFGSIRAQAKGDIKGAVDYTSWITKAEKMKADVTKDWQGLVKFSGIIRGSH